MSTELNESRRRKRRVSLLSRLWLHRQGVLGGSLVGFFVVIAIFAPWIAPQDPVAIDLGNTFAVPIWIDTQQGAGILGKDNLGRDILSRIIVGSRISLLVGFSSVAVGIISGIPLGLIAGYRGGIVGDIIMRVADTQSAIPFLVLLIAVIAFLGGSLLNIILFLGLGSWVGFARLVRGEELSLRDRDFVQAARVIGASDTRIMLRHILPNAIQPVIVSSSMTFGGIILTEAALSFLGLGVASIIPTWGKMVADSRDYIAVAWHLSASPALAIVLVVLGANLLGDWLRDVLDPRLRGR
ncbi:MAG: ABC transporter permease [SAR202 cluster bacterium]|nr:ABC transporter permease [SAR202 cluster bacterium]